MAAIPTLAILELAQRRCGEDAMQIQVEMPSVSTCVVARCTYNRDNTCHARAITVGHGSQPGCDTFMANDQHVRNKEMMAGVGACKVTVCRHNMDFECIADGISVGMRGKEINCLTFEAR